MLSWIKIILWNFFFVGVLLAGIEYISVTLEKRNIEQKQDKKIVRFIEGRFYPYLMWLAGNGVDVKVYEGSWFNTHKKSYVQFTQTQNNLGFTTNFNFSRFPTDQYLKVHGKQPNEKIILLTGGSAMHGVGASDNKNSIAGIMQSRLNESSTRYKYRVINLAMGSWVAYQQFIALDMFGSSFDPDWVVSMDGVNDCSGGANHRAGSGNPIFWANMLYYLKDGRRMLSPIETLFVEKSATYRLISGIDKGDVQDSIESGNLKLNPDDKRFFSYFETQWEQMDEISTAYIQSQKAMLRLFPKAKYILSSQPWAQPLMQEYRHAFAHAQLSENEVIERSIKLENALELINLRNRGTNLPNSDMYDYCLAKNAMALRHLVLAKQNEGNIYYVNMDSIFPEKYDERTDYFLDSMHLLDTGHKIIGEYLSEIIIKNEIH